MPARPLRTAASKQLVDSSNIRALIYGDEPPESELRVLRDLQAAPSLRTPRPELARPGAGPASKPSSRGGYGELGFERRDDLSNRSARPATAEPHITKPTPKPRQPDPSPYSRARPPTPAVEQAVVDDDPDRPATPRGRYSRKRVELRGSTPRTPPRRPDSVMRPHDMAALPPAGAEYLERALTPRAGMEGKAADPRSSGRQTPLVFRSGQVTPLVEAAAPPADLQADAALVPEEAAPEFADDVNDLEPMIPPALGQEDFGDMPQEVEDAVGFWDDGRHVAGVGLEKPVPHLPTAATQATKRERLIVREPLVVTPERTKRLAQLSEIYAAAHRGKGVPLALAEVPEKAEDAEEKLETPETSQSSAKAWPRRFKTMVRVGAERYAFLDEGAGEVKRYKWNPSFGWTRSLPPMPIYEADSIWVPSRRPIQ